MTVPSIMFVYTLAQVLFLSCCQAKPSSLVRRYYDKHDPHYSQKLDPWREFETTTEADIETLELAIGFFRHGSRSPKRTYPGDEHPFNDTRFWPDGPGQLTKVGKQQTFHRGQQLRERYGKFISDEYKPSEIEVYSNRVDRVFMSSSCLLAGLYPVVKEFQKWNPELPWQPIPIWEHPYDMTELLKSDKPCPAFHRELLKMDDEINKYNDQYSELMYLLSNNTRLGITNVGEMYKYFDLLYMPNDNGYGFPKWLDAKHQKLIWYLEAAGKALATSGTPTMRSMLAGPQLLQIKEAIKNKMKGKLSTKLLLYGVHETSINGLLPGLGFIKPFLVEPSATYIIELHKINGLYYIQMINYRDSKSKPKVMQIPRCQKFCPIKKVFRIMNKSIPKNWKKMCHETS